MLERLSLRQRLLLWLLPSTAALTLAWIVGTYAIAQHFVGRVYDWALEDTARTLAGQVRVERGSATVNLPAPALRMLEFDEFDQIYFSVTDPNGRQLAGNRALPAPPERGAAAPRVRFYLDDADGAPLRLVQYRMRGDGSLAVYVRVAETLHKRKNLAREMMVYMLGSQLLFLAGIVFLVWYGVGRGIAPLNRVRDAIARRTHEDLSPLDERGLPSEVQQQVHVINELMARLAGTLSMQRDFIADATHQLRTPIAVLRTQAELAQRAHDGAQRDAAGGGHDGEALRTLLAQMDAATLRLSRLASQLLSLSRAELGRADAARFADLAVAELVEDTVAALVPAALARRIELQVGIDPDLPPLHADRQLLHELLANLIDNAIRYTPPGGRIEVEARRDGAAVRFAVTDDGPGIAESERERVVERFVRGSKADSQGSGLGLAIAREIAALHGGALTLAASPHPSGLRVSVALPAADAPAARG